MDERYDISYCWNPSDYLQFTTFALKRQLMIARPSVDFAFPGKRDIPDTVANSVLRDNRIRSTLCRAQVSVAWEVETPLEA